MRLIPSWRPGVLQRLRQHAVDQGIQRRLHFRQARAGDRVLRAGGAGISSPASMPA
jgi:hypothetical protein